MKKIFQVMALVGFLIGATEAAYADTNANPDEVMALLQAMKKPQNSTALLLKAVLDKAAANGQKIEPSTLKVVKAGDNYLGEMELGADEGDEIPFVNFEAIVVRGKAYVFNFSVERISKTQPHPGVSLGNR